MDPRKGLTDQASRELGALFDLLHETGCVMTFRAESDPPTPRVDPVIVQGWRCGTLGIVLSVRRNSGSWTAFLPVANDCHEAASLAHLRETIEYMTGKGVGARKT